METLLLASLIPLLLGKRASASSSSSAARSAPQTSSRRGNGPIAGSGWVWPLPRLGGLAPRISDGYGSPRDRGTPDAHVHAGVDVMYTRRGGTLPRGTRYPIDDRGSRGFELPAGTPVLAAHDGRIWSARLTSKGWRIVIDHGPLPWTSVYQHLESIAIPEHVRGRPSDGGSPAIVKAGEPIGVAGFSPDDPREIRHLHFELRNPTRAVDPGPIMARWALVQP